MNSPALSSAKPSVASDLSRLIAALAFVLGVAAYTYYTVGHASMTLMMAAVFAAYMAMNIGANDVANNVGPAVGSRAMSMLTAILIAAVFEAAGAIIAGGEVVSTIKDGIIDPAKLADTQTFIWLMMAALLAAALWLNVATASGAPVSTTHSIVGAVLGAGVAAAGVDIANWAKVGQIVASWVISPVLGGIIAAAFLYLIKRTITYRNDLRAAAVQMVPVLVGLMVWMFSTYLILKGLKQLVEVEFAPALLIGLVIGAVVLVVVRLRLKAVSHRLESDKTAVNKLFVIPLVFSAALLSFAHGSNDVANAIGPLAAINDALMGSEIHGKAAIPAWIMWMGALGLSLGLALYGPKLIRTVGSEITEMDEMRAYCIAMAAAVTVIVASKLGLPVSTTHIAIGAVFGVGFLREYLKANYQRAIEDIILHHRDQGADEESVRIFLAQFEVAPVEQKSLMLKELKARGKRGESQFSKAERKGLGKVHKENLVKRALVVRVIAAWIITVPASGLMAAFLYYTIRGFMLP